MRTAIWNEKGTLDVMERDVPEVRPGWVRVRVAACGICGTDLHFFRGAFPSPAGLLPGHEFAGVVDAVGDGAEIAPGTPVAVEPLTGCGRCASCRTGQYNQCLSRRLFGIAARGGMAEYATIPADRVYPLPEGIDMTVATLAEPLAVCVRGMRRARAGLGDRVAILGAGTIGLLSIAVARQAGAAEVVVTARYPAQAALAYDLGATRVFESGEALAESQGGDMADVVIETIGGRAETLTEAVRITRPGGVIAMLGVFEGRAKIPALEFSTKELTMVGSNCYGMADGRSDFAIAVDLLERIGGQIAPVVTHRFPLDEVNQAFETAADKSTGSIKVHIVP